MSLHEHLLFFKKIAAKWLVYAVAWLPAKPFFLAAKNGMGDF